MLGVPIVPTRMTKRFIQITREFERMQPDIIALQEVYTGPQLTNLAKLLPSYPHIAYKPYVSGPRGGLAVFSKIPIESCAFIKLTKKEAITKKFVMSRVVRKGILVCRFQGYDLTLLNTQLNANLDSDWSPENRFMPVIRRQLTQLKDVIKEYQQTEKNLMVVGDFNIPKGSPIYNVFLKDIKMKDAFSRFSGPTLHLWFFEGWKVLERLDFIFYSGKNIQIKKSTEIFTEKYSVTRRFEGYLSDHIGLKVDISFTK